MCCNNTKLHVGLLLGWAADNKCPTISCWVVLEVVGVVNVLQVASNMRCGEGLEDVDEVFQHTCCDGEELILLKSCVEE